MPANIDRLVAERERLARNSAIVTGMMKTQQVSDWRRRPLTPEQVTYAALDAEVLVELYEVFKRDQPRLL